jgi:branched-chain amino acid aminotransferase
MLTQKPAAEGAPRPAGAPLDMASLTCLFEGRYCPLGEANVSIMTHAFMYGTAVFEGIRAYWNAEQGQLYALKVREHMERIRNSARILLMDDLPSVDQLTGEALEVIRRNGFREDAYVRPCSTRAPRRSAGSPGWSIAITSSPCRLRLRRHDGRRADRDRPGAGPGTAIPSRAKIVGSLQPRQQVRGDAQRLTRPSC